MPNLTQLRLTAREILDDALRAVDAGDAVRRVIRGEESWLEIRNETFDLTEAGVYSVAVGKAASPMALALEDLLGEKLKAGVIAGPIARQPQYTTLAALPRKLTTRWRWDESGHPLPNEASLGAANESIALLKRANEERALVIFLISGGGSAMIEWPISEDITLSDLRTANSILIKSGASIAEINSVRRAFSAVKGGRLAAHAPNCDQVTLIVSDVPVGEERNVASGPTLLPPKDAPDAREVLARYRLRGEMPPAVLRAIEHQSEIPPDPSDNSTKLREHFVLLNNNHALEAAAGSATRRGFTTEIASDIADEPIEVGCEKLLARLKGLRKSNPAGVCLLSGGEFACPVRGDGIGGRNLETALRLAIAASSPGSQIGPFVALCAGTDGIDGNSPAAGAIVDHTTIDRAGKVGLDPKDFLNRSDAYSFFVALGDVVTTGPTGTNVRDLRILLAGDSI
jgi:hydroxypyruvate reductase